MQRQHSIPHSLLTTTDLHVDAIYEGGSFGDVRDDPLGLLVGGGNQGGFRYEGSIEPFRVKFCVLYSDLADFDWPDRIDPETGRFTYYGDNKKLGGELHGTARQGNILLREIFSRRHLGQRDGIPPIFVFTKGARGRDVVFRGLAVPGGPGISESEDLVAVWRTKQGHRFQNYRSVFTILDAGTISRKWLQAIRDGAPTSGEAPPAWLEWRRSGEYRALTAPRVREYRTASEQLPTAASDLRLLDQIVAHYKGHKDGPYAFERCAAELFRLMQPNAHTIDLTRPWRDGGRDALGLYRVGLATSAINVEFALEAKCKSPSKSNSSGVRATARLVARIRHRQFGVFVTTSCIGDQASQELAEDGHPIIVMAGIDIVRTLKEHGLADPTALATWLASLDI
jgi:hypothetical protein